MSLLGPVVIAFLFIGMVTAIVIGAVALSRSTSSNLVSLNATQTLTNKTLTSPSIFHLHPSSGVPAISSGFPPFPGLTQTVQSTDTSGSISGTMTVSSAPTTGSITVLFSKPYTTKPGSVIVMPQSLAGYTAPREISVDWSTTSFTITEVFSATFTVASSTPLYNYIVMWPLGGITDAGRSRNVIDMEQSDEEIVRYLKIIGRRGFIDITRSLHMTKWIIEDCEARGFDNVSHHAACAGHLEVIKWIHQKGFICSEYVIAQAAGSGHLEIVEFLISQGLNYNGPAAMSNAVFGGHLEIIILLRSKGIDWDCDTLAHAAMKGHHHMVEWLIENGCPWEERAVYHAERNGHYSIASYLRDKRPAES